MFAGSTRPLANSPSSHRRGAQRSTSGLINRSSMHHQLRSLFRAAKQFPRCSWAERRDLAVAGCTAGAVTSLLHSCSFGRILSLLNWWERRRSPASRLPIEEEKRLLWAVEATCRRLFSRETCLTQAITAYVLLVLRGAQPPELQIGVKQLPDGTVAAHAWLEREDTVLIGGDVSPREYSRLLTPRKISAVGKETSSTLSSGIT